MNTSLFVILILQWVLLLGVAVVLVAVVRQLGILHQRISPAGALTISQGVKAGERVPELNLLTVDGEGLSIGGRDGENRSTLIMFVAPDCPVCAALIPAIRSIARQESSWLRIVFASDGDPAQHVAFRREKGLDSYPYVVSMELGLRFQVGKLPYAVLIDESGTLVAQGLSNSREHLESLFEARSLRVASLQEYLERKATITRNEVKTG